MPRYLRERPITMNNLIDRIRSVTPKPFDFKWLGDFVRSIDLSEVDMQGAVPEIDPASGNYARKILCMDPFEVVVLHWPPGVASAIHHHEGFWGYVLCVEGEVENVEYVHDAASRELREMSAMRVRAGGVLPEPDGTIHKIVNPSKDHPLVTLHFYAPALESLDGMVLFDAEQGWLAELNEHATTASFQQDKSGFRRLEQDAFTFVPMQARPGQETHMLYPLIPKPSGVEIMQSLEAYYTEQAGAYDALDVNSAKRSAYTGAIDAIIARSLSEFKPGRVLHIACGTGRRATEIREASGMDYVLEGVDISASMVSEARKKGVNARIGIWNECTVEQNAYDAVAFLYAFGHIPTVAERRKSLEKVWRSLRSGGRFYFDVFDVENPNEWGPEAIRLFDTLDLASEGYERGDLFYRRHHGEAVAFLHYCTASGIEELVTSCGFRILEMHRIGYADRSGEALSHDEAEGNLLLVAEKP